PDPQKFDTAKAVVEKFKAENYNPEGYTLYTYASMQVFAQAATAAGSKDPKAIAEKVRSGMEFDTVLGKMKLDTKGDVVDAAYVWYKWSGGKYTETDQP
ncbi:MAG: ABC transporter substrate-binding protein, partial [Parvibaculaceae bacterium]